MSATATTAKLGITVPASSNPDYESTNAVGLLTAAVSSLESAVLGATEYTAAGAIAIAPGKALLLAGSAAAMTLAAPTAGTNDGLELTIIALDAQAYTVTTPSNKINGNKHVATFGGAVGDAIKLTAFNGVWYAEFLNGVTLS